MYALRLWVSVTMKRTLCTQAMMFVTNGGATARASKIEATRLLDNRGYPGRRTW